MNHASVKFSNGTFIPLIGVPEDATEQQCATCKRRYHLSYIYLDEAGEAHCKYCLPLAELAAGDSVATVLRKLREIAAMKPYLYGGTVK